MKTNSEQARPPLKPFRRRWLRRIGIALLVTAALVALDYFAYPYGNWKSGRSGNAGENGLWLRYTWYFGKKNAEELAVLPARLKDRQIRYAWFHVRFIKKDGTLAFRYSENARRLVEKIHRDAPAIHVMAWVYAGNSNGEGEVDLRNDAVRSAMVREAVWLATECGFDGVQWDYEICPDGDEGFLALMRDTRAALPLGKLLGCATPLWMPPPINGFGWSDDYYEQVAETCDQIAVMGYDSGFWLPRAYAWLLRQQMVHATNAAARANPRCRILLGIPTYGRGGASHNPHAENIGIALKAARDAMTDPGFRREAFAGVALFADYTTQPEEWRSYEDLWLDK